MKRIWLDGPLGEIHIMEARRPSRRWNLRPSSRPSVAIGRPRLAAVREIEVGGAKALVTTRRTTISSRTIIFKIGEQT